MLTQHWLGYTQLAQSCGGQGGGPWRIPAPSPVLPLGPGPRGCPGQEVADEHFPATCPPSAQHREAETSALTANRGDMSHDVPRDVSRDVATFCPAQELCPAAHPTAPSPPQRIPLEMQKGQQHPLRWLHRPWAACLLPTEKHHPPAAPQVTLSEQAHMVPPHSKAIKMFLVTFSSSLLSSTVPTRTAPPQTGTSLTAPASAFPFPLQTPKWVPRPT